MAKRRLDDVAEEDRLEEAMRMVPEDVLTSGGTAHRARYEEQKDKDDQRGYPEYRNLSENEKQLVRHYVNKDSIPSGVSAVVRHWVDIFKARNYSRRGARKTVARGRYNYRRKGTYYRRGKASYQKRQWRTKYTTPPTLRELKPYTGISMAGAVHIEGDHHFPPMSAAFLQAVGSPFTELNDMPGGIMPRRPDPQFRGSSVGFQVQGRVKIWASYPFGTAAATAKDALTFAAAVPFGMGGLDIVGNQTSTGASEAFPAPSLAGLNAYLPKLFDRLSNGQQNYPLFNQQMADVEKWRITAGGFKQHDVGAKLTQQGEFFAHRCNWLKFLQYFKELEPNMTATQLMCYACFGVRGFLDYVPGVYFTDTEATISTLVKNARQVAIENADIGDQTTPDMGVTQRYREPRTEVDFCQFNPIVFHYDPSGSVPELATWKTWAVARTIMDSKLAGSSTWLEQLILRYDNTGVGHVGRMRGGAGQNYWTYMAISTAGTYAVLLTDDLLPIPLAELEMAKSMGNQGNSLLCIEASQMLSDATGVGRAINAFRSTYVEAQVKGTSQLYQTVAPYDPNYAALIDLASKFPVDVKGHSFFKSLWEGVKKAVRWVGKNEASIISGVQNGVRLINKAGAVMGA